MKFSKLIFVFFVLFSVTSPGAEDPTGGKPFFPWIWEDQFKPTLSQSTNGGNLSILAAGSLATVYAFQRERGIFEHNARGERLLMSREDAEFFGKVGSGALGIGIAVTQLFVDQQNGLMHSRAIILTTVTHVTMAYAIKKKRPGEREDFLPFASSFPSGHASSAFATATSLAYAYGYTAGVPAYLVATAIAAARVSENAHWLSDVVAGATLGIFWGRASYLATQDSSGAVWYPVPIDGGAMMQFSMSY